MNVQEFLDANKDRLQDNGYTLDELIIRDWYTEAVFFKKGLGQVSYAFILETIPDSFKFSEFLATLNWLLVYRYAGS